MGTKSIVGNVNYTGTVSINGTPISSSGGGGGSAEFATELDIRRLFRTEYTITKSITNGTATGDTSIWTQESASITITASNNYQLPSDITVSGASYTYNSTTGAVSLSNATSNVTLTCTCLAPLATPTISLSGDTLTMTSTDDVIDGFDIYSDGVKVIRVPCGYDVTISFTDGSETGYWLWTKIYDNYTISDYNNLYVSSANQIGEISSANGSTTVTTTTGKILIVGKGNSNSETESVGTITSSSDITSVGYKSSYESNGTLTSVSGYGSSGYVYVDGSTSLTHYSSALIYDFTVESDGTITINSADWCD